MDLRNDVRAAMRPRSTGMLLVLAMHVALGWLVVRGAGLRFTLPEPTGPLEARMLQERRAETPPPRPADPVVDIRTKVDVSPPELPQIDDDAMPPRDMVIGPIATKSDAETGGSAIAGSRREGVGVDPRHPLTQPPYPASSVRFGEEGTVTLELRVGRDGRVLEARVLQSSGSPRLDAAAMEEARRAWRLRPATENGSAIEASYAVRVSFRLDRR